MSKSRLVTAKVNTRLGTGTGEVVDSHILSSGSRYMSRFSQLLDLVFSNGANFGNSDLTQNQELIWFFFHNSSSALPSTVDTGPM